MHFLSIKSMLLIPLIQAAVPQFQSYSTVVEHHQPLNNITEHYMVTYDHEKDTQYYEYYNKSGLVCDKTFIGGAQKGNFYVRTEKDHFNCLKNVGDSVQIIPNLADFKDMGENYVDLRKMRHFRLQDIYDAKDESNNYLAAQTYQQDFWCITEFEKCKPYKWEIHGRSNLDSHQSVYVITYLSFSFTANQSVLTDKPAECNTKTTTETVSHRSNLHVIAAHAERKTQNAVLGENRKRIQQIQKEHRNFRVAPNKFAMLSAVERKHMFKSLRLGDAPSLPVCQMGAAKPVTPIDWRVRGVIGQVKDQATCGSCWTFGAIGVIEGRINVLIQAESRNQPLKEYSEQYLLDCFWDFDSGVESSQGCEGGSPDLALKYLGEKGTLAEALNYPYVGQNDYCKESRVVRDFNYTISNACRLDTVDAIKQALLDGPVSVGVAVSEGFLFYAGGILDDMECGSAYEELGHAVIVVGWGVDTGADGKQLEYWIVRNSWSNTWGMDGYIYIKITDNICGVATDATKVDIVKK